MGKTVYEYRIIAYEQLRDSFNIKIEELTSLVDAKSILYEKRRWFDDIIDYYKLCDKMPQNLYEDIGCPKLDNKAYQVCSDEIVKLKSEIVRYRGLLEYLEKDITRVSNKIAD